MRPLDCRARAGSFVDEDQALVDLTPEEEAALDRSEAAAARGEFASDAQVAAIWAKHGLCESPHRSRGRR